MQMIVFVFKIQIKEMNRENQADFVVNKMGRNRVKCQSMDIGLRRNLWSKYHDLPP